MATVVMLAVLLIYILSLRIFQFYEEISSFSCPAKAWKAIIQIKTEQSNNFEHKNDI